MAASVVIMGTLEFWVALMLAVAVAAFIVCGSIGGVQYLNDFYRAS